MKIALCGNPNVGKTTLYNRLTRSSEPVGNWHGVTVEARVKRVGEDIICDLPGAYSLTPLSKEESVTRDEILYGDYDAILFIAEVNNLRRNLYLFTQLAEAKKRVAIVVNMMDEARGNVDLRLLEDRLGVPVVGASDRYKGVAKSVMEAAKSARVPLEPSYIRSKEVAAAASAVENKARTAGLLPSFAALKLLECDKDVAVRLGERHCGDCTACHADIDLPARMRYAYIDAALSGVVEKTDMSRTARIDRIVLGKAAVPLFLLVMAAVFVITTEVGKPLSNLLLGLLAYIDAPVHASEMQPWLASLISDGIIRGVGGVLAFLPQVSLLFLLTALLQDSGYMSRVAFIADRFFERLGLSGRAAFSAVLALGCSVTSVLSARGESSVDAGRRTALAAPFLPCSARLAVFTAISSYFSLGGFVTAGLYALGVTAAICALKIMSLFSKPAGGRLLMEVPPYRLPSARRVASSVVKSLTSFICRVGTVVFAASVIMWVLCNFSVRYGFTGGVESSIMFTVSNAIAPVFLPLGFGNARAVAALVSGLIAKETVISTLGALGGVGSAFSGQLAATSFLIFTCLYVPCAATLAAISKEFGFKYALMSVVMHTAAAYAATLLFYQTAVSYTSDRALFYTVITISAILVVAAIVASAIKRRADGMKLFESRE